MDRRTFLLRSAMLATGTLVAALSPTLAEAAAKAAAQESTEVMAVEAAEPEIEAAYNVTGVRRKELVAAVGDFIGAKPEYLRAPTYAFAVGSYNIDKEGTLTGPENPALIESLKEQGFIAAE